MSKSFITYILCIALLVACTPHVEKKVDEIKIIKYGGERSGEGMAESTAGQPLRDHLVGCIARKGARRWPCGEQGQLSGDEG